MSAISRLRPSYNKSDYEGTDLTFQILDIVDQDTFPILSKEEQTELYREAAESGESVEDARRQKYPRQYRIRMSGVMDNGAPVTLDVGGFRPFFYVRIPDFDKDGKHTLTRLDQIRNGEISRINDKDIREHIVRMQNRAMDDDDADIDDETLQLVDFTKRLSKAQTKLEIITIMQKILK